MHELLQGRLRAGQGGPDQQRLNRPPAALRPGRPGPAVGPLVAPQPVEAGLPLDASALVGTSSVTLKSGRYYLSNAQAVGKLTLNLEGAVQLYLEGDIGAVGEGQVKLAKGATLDLFVDGKLTTVGEASFGDPSRPEAFRLYVGGKNAAITFAGRAGFHGLVYAPEADLSFAGKARIQGGLVAKHVSYAGELTVEGARVWSQPETCEDPAGTVPAKPEVVPAVPH